MSRPLKPLLSRALSHTTAAAGPFATLVAEKWLELSRLRRFLVDERITLVLDVGANEGQFAARLRKLDYQGTILSFEPDERAFTALARNCARDPKWRGLPWALGESDGVLPFHLAA